MAALPQFLALIEVLFIVVPFPPFSTLDFRLSTRGLQIEPVDFSKLDQVFDLSLRLFLPPAVSSNVAAFLCSTTSSGEDRWLKFANSALAKNGSRELRNNH